MTTDLTSFTFDEVDFDLSLVWLDVLGGRWQWTGRVNEAGQPMMQWDDDPPLPLPDVYLTYGPLIPVTQRPAAELVRSVLSTGVDVAASDKPADDVDPVAAPRTWASAAWGWCRDALRFPVGGAR